MRWIARLRCLVGCHASCYRERRPLAGVPVMHWVCEACGHAWPVMRRTPDEYREAARSQLRPLRSAVVLAPSAAERRRVLLRLTP